MSKISGVEELRGAIRLKITDAKHADSRYAVVGFAADYAVYVHENLTANHPNGGQAKFLEQPMRSMRAELFRLIVDLVKQGKSYVQARLAAALVLQKAAQALCPVDTGNLRASAYTTEGRK